MLRLSGLISLNRDVSSNIFHLIARAKRSDEKEEEEER